MSNNLGIFYLQDIMSLFTSMLRKHLVNESFQTIPMQNRWMALLMDELFSRNH